MPAKKLGLVVGLNSYREAAHLQGAVNDALDFRSELIARGFTPPTLLTDNNATRKAIVDQLHDLVGQLAHGDVGVFYFAGHGTQVKSSGNLPSAEALCPWDFSAVDPSSTIVDEVVLHLVMGAAKAHASLWVVLDSCFSGGFIEPLPLPGPPSPAALPFPVPPPLRPPFGRIRFAPSRLRHSNTPIDFPRRSAFMNLEPPSGVEIFTACRLDEKAAEADLDDEMRGVFTNFLVDRSAVDRGASAGDLRGAVEADIKAHGKDQTPQLSSKQGRIYLA